MPRQLALPEKKFHDKMFFPRKSWSQYHIHQHHIIITTIITIIIAIIITIVIIIVITIIITMIKATLPLVFLCDQLALQLWQRSHSCGI